MTQISAATVDCINTGTGAATRTVQSKLRDWLSRSDFGTLAQMWAANLYKPKFDPTTGKAWFNTDTSPLDYSASRAGFVVQHRDSANATTNELVPGAVDQFVVTGSGTVNAGAELSLSIWMGRYMSMKKTGDGSAHSATVTGELGAVGAGGYNELGGYQGELTNVGSALGTVSGVEMLLKDSPNGGTTSYSTRMHAIVGRIAKYNATTRASYNFFASSEGTLPPTAVLGVNPAGNMFQRGFDFSNAYFTTGQFGLVPNNNALAWKDVSGNAQPIISVSNTNTTFMRPASAAASIDLQDFSGASRLQIPGTTSQPIRILNATVSATATSGGWVLPANPAGFLLININGGNVKMPYYNV